MNFETWSTRPWQLYAPYRTVHTHTHTHTQRKVPVSKSNNEWKLMKPLDQIQLVLILTSNWIWIWSLYFNSELKITKLQKTTVWKLIMCFIRNNSRRIILINSLYLGIRLGRQRKSGGVASANFGSPTPYYKTSPNPKKTREIHIVLGRKKFKLGCSLPPWDQPCWGCMMSGNITKNFPS